MGAARRGKLRPGAVTAALTMSPTCANTPYRPLCLVLRSVVVLDVAGSNPVTHPIVMSQDIEDCDVSGHRGHRRNEAVRVDHAQHDRVDPLPEEHCAEVAAGAKRWVDDKLD
jgi:hypothetical protein